MVEGGRRHARALAAVALALVAAVAVVLLARAGGSRQELLAGRTSIAVKTSLSPGEHLFADSPLARLDVLVNRRLVDPGTVRVDASFKPYRVVQALPHVRKQIGDATRLEFRYRIDCLGPPCVPRKERRDYRLPDARITYLTRAERRSRAEAAAWPLLSVVSRVKRSDLTDRRFVDALDPLPAASYRIGPNLLAGVLLGLSLLLVLGTGAAAAMRLRGPAPPAKPAGARPAAPLSPLEQALALVERALAGQGVEEQRKALERLGRELVACDRRDLAGEARRLGWSRTGPSAGETRALSDRVRREVLGETEPPPTEVERVAAEHALAGRSG